MLISCNLCLRSPCIYLHKLSFLLLLPRIRVCHYKLLSFSTFRIEPSTRNCSSWSFYCSNHKIFLDQSIYQFCDKWRRVVGGAIIGNSSLLCLSPIYGKLSGKSGRFSHQFPRAPYQRKQKTTTITRGEICCERTERGGNEMKLWNRTHLRN